MGLRSLLSYFSRVYSVLWGGFPEQTSNPISQSISAKTLVDGDYTVFRGRKRVSIAWLQAVNPASNPIPIVQQAISTSTKRSQ